MKELTSRNSLSWKWLIGWVLANFIGILIIEILSFALAYFFSGGFGAPVENPEPVNYAKLLIEGLIMGTSTGAILGGFQSLVIMNHIKGSGRWFLATTGAFALTEILFLMSPLISGIYFNPNIWFWIILSVCLGIFQWIIIKKEVTNSKSGFWILANIALGVIAGKLGENWLLAGGFYWGLGNIITGSTLIWLFKNQENAKENQ